jgi:hypothetical protein
MPKRLYKSILKAGDIIGLILLGCVLVFAARAWH